MLWKRIAICSILTILVLYCFRNFIITNSIKPLRIEMEVYADKSILLECFYTTQAEESFVAGKSEKLLFQPKDSGLISISLPVEHLHKIRLDLGERPGKIRLGALTIPGHISLGYEAGISYYNIDNVAVNRGGVEIYSQQEDPYIIFNEPLNISATQALNINKSGILIALIISFTAFALFFKLFSFMGQLRLSSLDLALLFFFFALLPLPAAKINKAEISVEENRTLAKFPALIVEKQINNNFGTAFETWFNDRFFTRKWLVWLHNSIRTKVNNSEQNDHILIGKEGWAFNKHNGGVQNFKNQILFSSEELNHIARYLSSIENWCKDNNKKFYYLIAPDKNKIYGEYFRYAKKSRPDSESRTQQLISHLKEHTSVKIIYPYDAMIEAKKEGYLLYFKNDTHWTLLGAYVAYTELMKLISKDFNINPIHFEKLISTKHPHGDANYFFPEALPDDTITVYYYPELPILYKRSGDLKTEKNIYYHNSQGSHSAVFYRDSFAALLADYYFGNTFEYLNLKWSYSITEDDFQYILENNFDIVVLQQIERLVPELLNIEF